MLQFVTYICIFLRHRHVSVPYMEPVSFFGRFVEKIKVFSFSDTFSRKTTQQSVGSSMVTSDFQLL